MTLPGPPTFRRRWFGPLLAAALWSCAFWAAAASGQEPAAVNTLTQVGIGDSRDHTRLVFNFLEPLGPYTVKKESGGRVLVDLGPMKLGELGALPRHELITGIDFSTDGGRLTATVRLSAAEYDLRHFTSGDHYLLNLNFLPPEAPPPAEEAAAYQPAAEERPEMRPLAPPTLAEVAAGLNEEAPPGPDDGPAEHLLQRILGAVAAHNRPSARADLDFFLAEFPDHPRLELASYLKAELDFLSGPREETYAGAVEGWKSFLNQWPNSVLAGRARYMLAEADRLTGLANEAAAQFAVIANADGPPQDVYSKLALLKAADLFMEMGVTDEARRVLAPVLNLGLADRLGWEVYARAGAADFYQGFHSQATDILREALRQAPGIQQTFPNILYALGEAYHYLNRPDLSRRYLTQAINLMPDHPKADIILTRIGDGYRLEGLPREAIAVYGAVRRNYPEGEGGLISQVRLADMGSLHSFFSQEKVFDALEKGSRGATVEMYRTIADAGFHSPLVQLAQLKIGTALAEEGENNEAIKWLRDLEINDPKSSLLPEALPVLNTALTEEMLLRQALSDWQGICDLYADNSYYISDEDRPHIERLVANAFEKLGRFGEALDLWAAMKETEPGRRLARAKGLVTNSLNAGRPQEALEHALAMAAEFPGEQPWIDEQLPLVERGLARPHNAEAVAGLLALRDAVTAEPVRRDALSDAITIEIEAQRYDRAAAMIRRYRLEYPEDELSPEYLLTLAQIDDYQKRPDQAWDILSDFRQAYPDDPRNRRLLLDQIAKADSLGRDDDAFRFMELYRGRYPDDPASGDMMLQKMDRLWQSGRFDDSRDTLEAFRRDYPDDHRIPESLMALAEKDRGGGRRQEALWAAGELIDHYRGRPDTLKFLIEQAEKNWAAELYEDAQKLADRLLAAYPGEAPLADFLLQRAADDWSRGRFDDALAGWDTFRRAFPGDGRVSPSYLDQYKKMVAGGFAADAFQLAEGFLASPNGDAAVQADLMLEKAKDYFALDRPGEGLAMWERFRQTFPGDGRNADLMLIQARRELKSGLGSEAVRHYQDFLDHYPSDGRLPDVYLETAAAEAALNRPEEAWRRLGSYIALFPSHPGRPQAILDAAELGRQLAHLPEAVELFEIFRRDYPASPSAPATYLAEARLKLAAGDQPGAAATLEDGLLAQPALDQDPQVQALLINLYLEEGRVEDWAALVEKNLDRAAPGAQADRFQKYYQLSQVYQELGRSTDVERNLDAALANRDTGVTPENLYAVAQSYRQLLRPDKYRSTLALVQETGDSFWQQIAADELASETTSPPSTPAS